MNSWLHEDVDPRTLTPQQRAERENALREKSAAAAEIEERAQFNEEWIMDERNPDQTTVRGKKVGQKKYRPGHHEKNKEEKIQDFLAASMLSNAAKTAREIILFASQMARNFYTAAPAPGYDDAAAIRYEDESHIYDMMMVSRATAVALDAEAQEINERMRRLKAIQCDEQRRIEADKILRLAEDYQMRRHPVTGRFVHDIARVEAEEALHNPAGAECHGGMVCVFRLKAEIGSGSRNMKVNLADQYDQDPSELVASGDHLKGHTAPQHAPQLNHG